ncbi:hypothetical protein Tco_0634817 [Tanacetum coccineum]
MAEPITCDYTSATEKSFISSDSNGKMIEKNIIEIEGRFLLKIRVNAFHGMYGEDVYKHINSFLKVVEPLKIRGISHDRFRLSVFPTSLSGAAKQWFTNECIGTISTWDNLIEKFILKFHNLCEYDMEEETDDEVYDLHTFDNVPKIFKIDDVHDTYVNRDELNKIKHKVTRTHWSGKCGTIPTMKLPGMLQVGTMTYFQDHSWYDNLADGKLKDETLALKTKIEGAWGDVIR